MTFLSVCNRCLQSYELTILQKDKELVSQLEDATGFAKCPRHCGGFINLYPVTEFTALRDGNVLARDPMQLTAKELYGAVFGAGLPDEIPRHPELVESILKANKVVGVKLEQTDERSGIYLHEIVLENGLTIHLGGGIGPRVVKITKETKCSI